MQKLRKTWIDFLAGAPQAHQAFRAGDTLRVKYEGSGGFWQSRTFTGFCVSKKAHKQGCRYTLKSFIKDVEVTMSFDSFNPHIISVEKIRTLEKKRRATFYHLRSEAKQSS